MVKFHSDHLLQVKNQQADFSVAYSCLCKEESKLRIPQVLRRQKATLKCSHLAERGPMNLSDNQRELLRELVKVNNHPYGSWLCLSRKESGDCYETSGAIVAQDMSKLADVRYLTIATDEVDVLERNGYIQRHPDDGEGNISLTPEGLDLMKK